jgi:clan AA aspartic protease (TIGR02281 family)
MTGAVPIVAATRDKAAVGRQILGTAAGAVIGAGVLIAQLGGGFAAPPWELSQAGNSLVVPAAANGQCHVDLLIGEARFRGSLEDTGADGFVTLGRNQAKQAGIDTRLLRFTGTYESANGRARFAQTRVPWVRIGNAFDLADLPVAVTEIDQPQVLIGIQILRHYNFRLRSGRCELSARPT